jgi:uncharacterized membrane protein YqgA involved in biofilm formation
MPGVLVNTLAVIIGSLLGLSLRRGIPEKITRAVMSAIGLCTLYLGISGALAGKNAIIAIVSLVLGAALGTWLDIDGAIRRLGDWVGLKLKRPDQPGKAIGEGFITASLLFCVGSMTIVGSLNAGLLNDHTMLFAKSVLDFISAIMLSVSLGVGVLLSAAFVLIFQGAIVVLAQFLRPVLNSAAIAEMSCVGGILVLAVGLNLLNITKIKAADLLPALIFAPLIVFLLAQL